MGSRSSERRLALTSPTPAPDGLILTSGDCAYALSVKTIWTGRMAQAAGKYGENAPMATVCCNACRTCVTTNIVGIAMAAVASADYAVANFTRRRIAPRSVS